MNDTYHYEEGAIHNDNKKVIQIGSVGVDDVGKLLNVFLHDGIEDAKLLDDDDDGEAPLPSFGLPGDKQKHWVDVYHRLVARGWIRKEDVSQMEFIYILCAVGNKRYKKIQWHGATNTLAHIVRLKLIRSTVDKWDVAKKVFLDKNNNPLPSTFENSKSPGQKTAKIIDDIFK